MHYVVIGMAEAVAGCGPLDVEVRKVCEKAVNVHFTGSWSHLNPYSGVPTCTTIAEWAHSMISQGSP